MANLGALAKQLRFGETSRSDAWWMQPILVFLGFSAFIVYSTWAAFQGLDSTRCYYWYGGNGADYLSPFYSPSLFGSQAHPGIFGVTPSWWPGFVPFSPAFLIMWIPAGFRFTCYYYRGAYYKAFWLDPVNCTVGEPRKSYLGERYLPLVLQNIHRYFLYLALCFIVILGRDAFDSMWFKDAAGDVPLWPRRWIAGADYQRHSPCRLHSRLPFAPPPGRRISGCEVEGFRLRQLLQRRQLPQSPPHALGLDEPLLGRLHRRLYPPLRHGRLDRFPFLLT